MKKIIFICFIILIFIFITLSLSVKAYNVKLIEGNLNWTYKIGGIKGVGYGVYEIEGSPKKVEWFWRGEGNFYVYVKYADGNELYYVMEGSKIPNVSRKVFIDENGVPRIIVPHVVKLKQGKIYLDLELEYTKHFGSKSVSVSKFIIYFNGSGEFSNFKVIEYYKEKYYEKLNFVNKSVYIDAQIPKGNYGKPYLMKDRWIPIKITIRAILNETRETKLIIKGDIEVKENNVTEIIISPGYFEKEVILHVKPKFDAGKIYIELKDLENRSYEFITLDEETIKNNIKIYDVGIYPIRKTGHKDIIIEKNIKNYIKIKEDFSSWFHRIFGHEESFDEPAGLVSCVLVNKLDVDIPLHVKFSVYSGGEEVKFFRGEHIQREEMLGHTPVPETLIILEKNSMKELRMPIYADVYSVKVGRYEGVLNVSLVFDNITIVSERFEFYVGKESQIKTIVCIIAIILSILSFSILIIKQKKWISDLKTHELMIISLFTAVKFSIVDIPWFIFGDLIRAIFGPLGPFIHLVTGIFWDIIHPLFLVALVWLIPKPGVVIISSVIRIILSGIVFGSFNPVIILMVLSYSALTEFMLYLCGFTRGKADRCYLLLPLIFAIKHIYSTYTFYYIWMYMYRLFYPDWYINLNAISSAIYSALGAIVGIRLGKKLRRVVE